LSAACGIVTLADANYFPGLQTLYLSVQQSWPVPVTCFDIGLSAAQKELAARRYPALTILPLPASEDIEAVRRAFSDAGPLAKPGKRVWPIWICPLLIAASPYRRVFWIDCDVVVLRNLRGLFELLESGPVFTPENFAPDQTPNKPELYELLPIAHPFDRSSPVVNAGVSGWDLERDREALEAYIVPVRHASRDPRVASAISWWDQGCLIWAIQKTRLEHRVVPTPEWNRCARNTRAFGNRYHPWGEAVLDELRRDVPEANLLHWNGLAAPWLT